jgi:hypothetical protein
MPAPAWEDLDDFLRDDDFACPAVITLQAGGTIPLSVIFDEHGIQAQAGEYEHDTTRPTATGKEYLLRPVRRGDSIAITFPEGARTFDVLASAKPTGDGMASLDLSE